MVSERTIGDVVNVGNGREISINDLAKLTRKLVGRDGIVETDEQRVRPASSEVERLLADNRKAKEIMGWEPKESLQEGLRYTIEWIRTHIDLFQIEHHAVQSSSGMPSLVVRAWHPLSAGPGCD